MAKYLTPEQRAIEQDYRRYRTKPERAAAMAGTIERYEAIKELEREGLEEADRYASQGITVPKTMDVLGPGAPIVFMPTVPEEQRGLFPVLDFWRPTHMGTSAKLWKLREKAMLFAGDPKSSTYGHKVTQNLEALLKEREPKLYKSYLDIREHMKKNPNPEIELLKR